MKKDLTKKQQNILNFIIEFRANGKTPTLAEIAEYFGYRNRSTVQQHLQAIEKKGYIKRNAKISRGIELTYEENFYKTHPLLGEVAAGNPLAIYPDSIDSVELPAIVRIPENSFLLKVKGDSLKDAYIFSGDIVIVNPNMEPLNGNFIVAILDNEAVVKRLKKVNGGIELHSENPDFDPIVIDNSDQNFKVVGVVIGIYRTMNSN